MKFIDEDRPLKAGKSYQTRSEQWLFKTWSQERNNKLYKELKKYAKDCKNKLLFSCK